MQLRPASVPKAARFSRNEDWWQVGEIRDGVPFGRWRTFRADGSPLFEARFDSRGRLQGTFRRFHPDGTIAREAQYTHGKPAGEHVYYRGPGDVFPCGDRRVLRVVIRHGKGGAETERALFDAAGREVSDEPVPVPAAAGALDEMFAAASPDGFATSTALPAIIKGFGSAAPRQVDDLLLPLDNPSSRRWMTPERFAELYGRPMPADLRAWRQIGDPKLLGMRTVRDDDIAGDGNVIEALIAEHQQAPGRATALRELVTGIFGVGETDDDVRYCVGLCELFVENPTEAIYALHPANDTIDQPDARSLDDFIYVVTLATALDARSVSLDCAKITYERLRGRVDLRPPLTMVHERVFEGGDDDDETVGDTAGDHREGFNFRRGKQAVGFYFHRSRWLLKLLRGNAVAAAAEFQPKDDGGLDDERYKRIRAHAPKEPWVAFYWLFRSFVFDDPRLDDLLRACGDTPSRLVREIAALVGELAEGRRKLGSVDDMGAVVRQFRALDPMSNKPDSDGVDETPERPEVPEELEPAYRVIEWANNEGYEREGLVMDDEVDAAGLGLALRADPAIVPFIVSFVEAKPWLGEKLLAPWLDGRIDVAELLPAARRWLIDLGDGALSKWELAAQIVERVGGADDANALGKLVEPMFDQLLHHGQGGFEAAMGRMKFGDALHPMSRAIGKLGVPDAFLASFEAAVMAESRHQDDARGPCALALGLSGKGLDAIVTGVRRMIDTDRGDKVSFEQLYAIGLLGRQLDDARRRELAQLVASLEDLDPYPAAGQALAAYDLSGDGTPVEAVRAALAKDAWRDEMSTAQRVLLLGLVETRADLPAELALPYVITYDVAVHRAAIRALRARGAEIPAYTVYDPFYLASIDDRDALHAGLDDPQGVYRSNVALWLGDHLEPADRAALVRSARRCAGEPDFPDDGPRHYELRWVVRALVALGGDDEVLVELLCHDNRNVAKPVLRYANKLGPGIAKGMAHVFVHDENWTKSTARSWLAKHRRDQLTIDALDSYGLTIDDVRKGDAE